ncbi:MAG TPA: PadR family transcriptional regulator [Gemmatimonadota bacterium]|nr:PadR family transcriptional regulator [Gemmatimonadota bacterium]
MSLPHILLGLLREPASGYDLKAEFEQGIRHYWSAELSQIYPTLKRMEGQGWLSSATEPSDRGPDRRVYTRTRAGHEELLRWLEGGPQVGAERFAYLAQIAFMGELGDFRRTLAFMRALRVRLAAWEAELNAIEAGVFSALPGYPDDLPPDELHHHVTLRMGLHTLAAKLAWCDETIARLERRLAATTGHRSGVTPTFHER